MFAVFGVFRQARPNGNRADSRRKMRQKKGQLTQVLLNLCRTCQAEMVAVPNRTLGLDTNFNVGTFTDRGNGAHCSPPLPCLLLLALAAAPTCSQNENLNVKARFSAPVPRIKRILTTPQVIHKPISPVVCAGCLGGTTT
jgi:hypothetical protein